NARVVDLDKEDVLVDRPRIRGKTHPPVVRGQLEAFEQIGRRGKAKHDCGSECTKSEAGRQLTKNHPGGRQDRTILPCCADGCRCATTSTRGRSGSSRAVQLWRGVCQIAT